MLKSFLKKLLFLSTILGFQFASAKEVVVLVPGFFNSFAPEYFSQDIVKSFASKGFQVYIAQGLNPLGTIEDNGSRLESIFQEIERAENKHIAFNIVAHSAGGFYSLWLANRQKFEIKNILTVSTPFKGVEFIQEWLAHSFLFRAVTELAHLEGLTEMTTTGISQFMNSIRVSPQTRVISFGGYQTTGFDITDAREMSVPLRITDHFITGKSDGIVGFKSAMGLTGLKTTANLPALQYKDEKYLINLEHWEQVLDSRAFVLLGIRNTGYIRNEQVRFFSGLADFLLKPN